MCRQFLAVDILKVTRRWATRGDAACLLPLLWPCVVIIAALQFSKFSRDALSFNKAQLILNIMCREIIK